MSLLGWYLVITGIALVIVSVIGWAEFRGGHDITLQQILVSAIMVFIPGLNVISLIAASWFFIDEIAPHIVVFKGKRK